MSTYLSLKIETISTLAMTLFIILVYRLIFRCRCRCFLLFHFFFIASCAPSDSLFLLKFKDSLQSENASSLPLLLATWNASTADPCSGRAANWIGLLCNREGRVWGIRLENMALHGLIDVHSLKSLPHLRTLSFMQNHFHGPLPDVTQLGALKSLYLSGNRFSGALDNAMFLGMASLKKLHLARNQLEGRIPDSLALLPKLIELRLEGNRFEGPVPDFTRRTWLSFNLSNNELHGRVPPGLTTLNASSFYGNKGLCGEPVKACWAHNTSSLLSIVVLGVVVLMALSAIGAMFMILCRCTRLCSPPIAEPRTDGHHLTIPPSSPVRSPGGLKLCFLREDRERFEMQELLSASAEMLGSGSLGSSYKAALGSGGLRPVTVVVKRFKQMNNVGREEFQEHMRRIGGLRHPNVLPLVAFYYKKDEKLLVSDFVENSSLAFHLHGREGTSEGVERSTWALDARTRLNIAKGVARGLKYLHDELPSVMAAHGHLKASNVLLKEYTHQPLLSDYGLIPLINQEHAQQQMTAYKSPEYSRHGRITKKTDVWSLGLLILEMLTGKTCPASATVTTKEEDRVEDLAEWVKSARDQDEVFDKELFMRSDAATMVVMEKLLRIGMECCEAEVEKRLDMKEALHKIENLKDHRDGITNAAFATTTSATSASDVETFHSSELEIRTASFEHENQAS